MGTKKILSATGRLSNIYNLYTHAHTHTCMHACMHNHFIALWILSSNTNLDFTETRNS